MTNVPLHQKRQKGGRGGGFGHLTRMPPCPILVKVFERFSRADTGHSAEMSSLSWLRNTKKS